MAVTDEADGVDAVRGRRRGSSGRVTVIGVRGRGRGHSATGRSSVELVVLGQQAAQVRDVARRQAQCVQLGQLRVGRNPRQRGLETSERTTQHLIHK